MCPQGRGALQDIDQVSVMKSLCKHVATVQTVRDIVPTLRTAIHHAMSGTPGPVLVEFPLDVLHPFSVVQREYGIRDLHFSFAKFWQWYLQLYALLHLIF